MKHELNEWILEIIISYYDNLYPEKCNNILFNILNSLVSRWLSLCHDYAAMPTAHAPWSEEILYWF